VDLFALKEAKEYVMSVLLPDQKPGRFKFCAESLVAAVRVSIFCTQAPERNLKQQSVYVHLFTLKKVRSWLMTVLLFNQKQRRCKTCAESMAAVV